MSPAGHLNWLPIIESLLIGVLVGAQREAVKPSGRVGVREFVAVAIIGSLCGMLENNWLTVASLLSLVIFLTSFRFRVDDSEGLGLTTDLALLAVFCLTFAGSWDDFTHGQSTAVGLGIILTIFLEAKDKLRKFFRETITQVEFSDTLRFLALIFIIYPLLPPEDIGPFHAFNAQRIWMFVILVSSVSFIGYFFEKFLGQSIGIKLTAVLGGLASTTATTSTFAKEMKEMPEAENIYWQGCTIANAVQFPRILAFLSVVSPNLAAVALWPLAAAGVAGFSMAYMIHTKKLESIEKDRQQIDLGNPFTIGPALKFGGILAVIIFVTKAAAVCFGPQSLVWTSCLGGMLDVDAIAVTVGDLYHGGKLTNTLAVISLLLAMLMNAFFKIGAAASMGSKRFGIKVAASFLIMFGTALIVILVRGLQ
ncbi:MAG: DUF4010 domain-containing protein [Candidatus Obscuribacterales bacterium]|nr:DUF4010 domain-containing protein [Candidatus Obscuribacterales bacterium]